MRSFSAVNPLIHLRSLFTVRSVVLFAIVGTVGLWASPAARASSNLNWTSRADMPTNRTLLGVASVGTKVYAIGGIRLGSCLNTVEEYDTATDTWRARASMPTARNSLAVVADANGKVYAIGGVQNPVYGVVERYDPATDTWQTMAPMPTPRFQLAAALGSNGKIYAIGGQSGGAGGPTGNYLNTVEEYDPTTNIWQTKAPMPTARYLLAAVGSTNGKIYAIGGGGYPTNFGAPGPVEEFDPVANTWATKTGMPTARDGLAGAVSSDGTIYAVGGGPSSSDGNAVEAYHPTTDSWTTELSLPSVRRELGAAFASNGKLYAIGGSVQGTELKTNDEATILQTGPPSLAVSPSQVIPGGSVTVTWSSFTPSGNDWISITPAGAADSQFVTFQTITGSSGSAIFVAPTPPGTYDARLFQNGTKVATSSSTFVVVNVTYTVLRAWLGDAAGVEKTTFNAGDTIKYNGNVTTNSPVQQTVTVTWLAAGPCGSINFSTANLTALVPATTFTSANTVPNAACSGAYTLTVTVTYNGTSTFNAAPGTFTVNPSPDLSLTAMEVTQGIQDLANSMPLVDGRETYVRAYVQSTLRNSPGTKAQLRAFRNGTEIAKSPWPAENNPIVVQTSGGSRLNLSDSFYFRLPAEWRNGTILLRVEVNYDNSVPESNLTNNSMDYTATFNVGTKINLRLVPFLLYDLGDSTKPSKIINGDDPRVVKVVNELIRYYPLSADNLNWQYNLAVETPGTAPNWNMSIDADQSKILARLRELDAQTTSKPAGLFWVAMIDPTLNAKGYFGLGNLPGVASWVVMNSSPETVTSGPGPVWSSVGGSTLAQELGHNIGYKHAFCAGNETNNDPNWPHPYPKCSLATVDPAGFYGFDVYWDSFGASSPTVISNDPTAPVANGAFPFMSYAAPAYASPYEYCNFLVTFGVACNLAGNPSLSQPMPRSGSPIGSGPSPAIAPHAALAAPQSVTVSALISTSAITATLLDVADSVNVAPTPPPPGTGPAYNLVQLDGSGTLLASQQIPLDTDAHFATTVQSPLIVAPLATGTAKIQIWTGATMLAERVASAHPPTVQIVSPNGGVPLAPGSTVVWTAADVDGDPLTFSVLYSHDNGSSWQTIGVNLTGNSFVIPALGDLAGTTQGRMRVVANDGFHTAQSDSANVFTVPASPPRVQIMQASPGVVLIAHPGHPLFLSGSATDVQDGKLTGASLSWSSSLDGALGTGSEVELGTLSNGRHLITLTATDSAGLTSTASVTVIAGPGSTVYLPSIHR